MSPTAVPETPSDSRTAEYEIEAEEVNVRGLPIFKRIVITDAEWPCVILMGVLFFLITFIHTIFSNLRDMAIMGRQVPMSILFIKSILLLPCSVFFVGLIQKGLTMYSVSRIFDITFLVFSMFYLVFGILLWPRKVDLQPDFFLVMDIFSDAKMEMIGLNFLSPVFLMVAEWMTSLLFIFSELWGALVVSYLFNIFVNNISTRAQSRRFIPFYMLLNGFSILTSGITTIFLDRYRDGLSYESKDLGFRVVIFTFTGLIFLSLYVKKRLERKLKGSSAFSTTLAVPIKMNKSKLTFSEEMRMLLRSRLLLAISLTILFYGISSTLIEGTFKGGLAATAEHLNRSKEEYSNFYNGCEQLIISLSLILAVNTPLPALVKNRGWKYVASVPIVVTTLSIFFVFMTAFYNVAASGEGNLILKSLFRSSKAKFPLENVLGLFSFSLVRLSKYISLDVTKEAISMQIDPEERAKYKAVYDGLCGKMGKSLGAILCTGMTMIFDISEFRKVAPISACIVALISLAWIKIVAYLQKKYSESVETNSHISVDIVE
jgi:ATP:ADP antiporter, AAA family